MKISSALTPPENVTLIEHFNVLLQNALHKNLTTQVCLYRKILRSLKRYPLPLNSSTQACRLEGVGRGNASLFPKYASTADVQVSKESRARHCQKVLNAMKQFANMLETNPSVVFEPVFKRPQCPSLRLIPGTSAWTIILCIYVFSHHFPQRELGETDILKAAQVLCKFDPRFKISSWKSITKLISCGYLVSRPTTLEDNCSCKRKRTSLLYQLTESGRTVTESLLCALDLPSPKSLLDYTKHQTSLKESIDGPLKVPLKQRVKTHINLKTHNRNSSTTANETQENTPNIPKREIQAELFKNYFSCPSNKKPCDEQEEISHQADKISSFEFSALQNHSPTNKLCPKIHCDSLNGSEPVIPKEANSPSVFSEPAVRLCKIQNTREEELLSCLIEHVQTNPLQKNMFDIFCLVDCRELKNKSFPEMSCSSNWKTQASISRGSITKCSLYNILREKQLDFESALLPIGDFAWVCRFKKPKHLVFSTKLRSILNSNALGSSTEDTTFQRGYSQDIDFILPYLVERKTPHDLASSILDGRYEDQKFRLLRSPGIQCSVYLVEGSLKEFTNIYKQMSRGCPSNTNASDQSVQSALASIQIKGGIHIIFSSDLLNTAEIVIALHAMLKSRFETFFETFHSCQDLSSGGALLLHLIAHCPLRSIWNSRSRRLMTVHDVFGRQLRSIESIGEKTVIFLLTHFNNPAHLKKALEMFPRNSAFQSSLLETLDFDCLEPPSRAQKHIYLTSRVMTALRELYAPSTVSLSRTPEQHGKKQRNKTNFTLKPIHQVKKRIRSIKQVCSKFDLPCKVNGNVTKE